jgi:hypothetical protein
MERFAFVKKIKYKNSNIKIQERPAAESFYRKIITTYRDSTIFIFSFLFLIFISGCGGYSNKPLFTDEVQSVCVEMFDNKTFERDLEYDLTDAIVKRIEAETPYKIVSDKSRADTVLSGKITEMSTSALALDRDIARPLESQAQVTAEFSWKNLKTGQYLVEKETVSATASYSEFEQQGFNYASKLAANKLAERIVEQMQTKW